MSITLKNQSALSQDEEADLLISALHAWGIDYLIAGSQNAAMKRVARRLAPVELIKRLARCELPRVRDASIALFLLHPELADAALEAYKISEPLDAGQVAVLILAALYLQRLWSFRLTIALGHKPNFPEQQFAHFWQVRQLPSPQCQYGKPGLEALQAREQQRRGLPLNLIGDWQNQIDHLLRQKESKRKPAANNTELMILHDKDEQEKYSENVTRADIEKFLNALGKAYRKEGRLYLAGGAALVHMGLRSGSTLDIDVVIEASNEDEMITAIRRLVEQM